jgi:selenide,water dikinase
MPTVRLTTLSHGAGCACKLPSAALAEALRGLPPVTDPAVLTAHAGFEDAAAYRLSDELALVQTVDFFTPVVDDPEAWGRVAAANAISDVYAMGGRPLFALAVAAWPRELDLELLGRVLAAGAAKAAEAGASVVGGHTVDDPEPKYGLAVTGLVHPQALWRNAGGRAGDRLFLTKRLGTGVVTTAIKREAASAAAAAAAVASMERLNAAAAEAVREAGPSAVTDVTGFGLVGHVHELAQASGLAAEIETEGLRFLPQAVELARDGHVPGGSLRNLEAAAAYATFAPQLDEVACQLACDAQTSGGLLVALPPARVERLLDACRRHEVEAFPVGELGSGPAGRVLVR